MLNSSQLQTLAQRLESMLPDANSSSSDADSLANLAIELARQLQQRSHDLQTPAERRQQTELDRMIQSPHDKATLTQMTDQTFRSRHAQRSADQFIHILDVQGIPRFFSPLDRTLLRGFQSFGSYLPGVAMPLVKDKMKQETANVILPAEEDHLAAHLERRRVEGVRMNVNHLGEALLGERDARRRLENYLAILQRPEIEVISVKISTIYSQISPLARKHTVEELCDRLELLFRAATRGKFTRHDGQEVPKFVYLDMEEYRDMHLTAAAFMQTLDRPGLADAHAGIALQAYVPDSYLVQQELLAWARDRVASGGAPITIRLVKGANMEMERVEASIEGWPQAPYKQKIDSDANYVRMLREAFLPENREAVRLGIASHNLFTLAYGIVAAHSTEMLDRVQFEMLEGMANHQRRALFELVQNLLLYAPAAYQDDFVSAIGYLVRRLDENTGPDNFLRHAFNVKVDSEEWNRLEQQFRESFTKVDTVRSTPRRTQDRRQADESIEHSPNDPFKNEPNTDWSLPHHSEWAESIIDSWQPRHGECAGEVPLVIAGEVIADERACFETSDPSRPGCVVGRIQSATSDDVERAVNCAVQDVDNWQQRSHEVRTSILYRAAELMSERRGDLLGVMMAEGGKLFTESDPEISEAIDFCRYYAQTAEYFQQLPGLESQGKGVVIVVSPWNFPLAIPCGGVAAALVAGNNVILKPAPETAWIAYEMCRTLWDAGVPKTALQLVNCAKRELAQRLVTHPAADIVILTGGTATAAHLLNVKPSMQLLAETGGKNATIVTALADRDLAIKNVVYSAFGHSGQKCSATSLLMLEDEVYHDESFRSALCDAVESLKVGSAWNLATRVGPLIRPPQYPLEQALKELELGESWAVMPEVGVEDNPHLVSPGVKWNVSPDSTTHCTEFFGPLLGVMKFGSLSEAINLVNATGFGLTSGLESLDDREQELWQTGIRAGNLYMNRSTTGAIVQRQPFGGMGKSNVGPGIKAGGPNYVAQLLDFAECSTVTATSTKNTPASSHAKQLADLFDSNRTLGLSRAVESYEYWAEEEFLREHDEVGLLGEDNYRRYLSLELIRVRVQPSDTAFELLARVAAVFTTGARVVISVPPLSDDSEIARVVHQLDQATHEWGAVIEFVEETDDELADAIIDNLAGRIRYAQPDRVPDVIRSAAASVMEYVADQPVSPSGRIELLWYLREQSITNRYHRYGNLGFRAGEDRDEPA